MVESNLEPSLSDRIEMWSQIKYRWNFKKLQVETNICFPITSDNFERKLKFVWPKSIYSWIQCLQQLSKLRQKITKYNSLSFISIKYSNKSYLRNSHQICWAYRALKIDIQSLSRNRIYMNLNISLQRIPPTRIQVLTIWIFKTLLKS